MPTKWEDCGTEAMLTPRVRYIINRAAECAAKRGAGEFVEDIDLLNAMIDEGAGRASRVLQGLLELQRRIEEMLDKASPEAPSER